MRKGDTVLFRNRSLGSWPLFLCGAGALIALVFALLNPEPSRSLPLVSRLLFWSLHVGALLAAMQLTQLALSRLAPGTRRDGWVRITAAGLVGAAVFAPIAVLLDQLFGLSVVADDTMQALADTIVEEFGVLAPPAVFTWLGLNALKTLPLPPALRESRSSDLGADDEVQPERPPEIAKTVAAGSAPFMAHLPTQLGRDLISLSAELHYLRVETARGNALIHYPFSRAVAELASHVPGAQIHRSHWVADAHVAHLKREGDQTYCVLDNGGALPVGRRRRAEIGARYAGRPDRLARSEHD